MKQRMACLLIGILMGAVLLGGNVSQAAEAFLKAFPSTHTFYLDGQPIEMEAYSINGNNYVKLRDIGRMVGFNVYWDNGVQIDTSSPYTGTVPSAVTIGSYKGTVLDVGERSALIIPDGGTDYTVASGNPAVLAVEQVSGYWVIEGVSPGTAQVQFTAPNGQQGILAITVTEDGTLTNSASADLNENLEIRQDILALVNKVRQEHGLSAVPADPSLMDAAQDYATRRNTWHDSQEECELALAHGYPYGFNCNLTVFTGASAEGAQDRGGKLGQFPRASADHTGLQGGRPGSWCGAARGSDLLLSVCRHVKHNQPIRIMPYMRKAFQQPLEGFFLAKFN